MGNKVLVSSLPGFRMIRVVEDWVGLWELPGWIPRFVGVSVRTHAHTPKSGPLHAESQRADWVDRHALAAGWYNLFLTCLFHR